MAIDRDRLMRQYAPRLQNAELSTWFKEVLQRARDVGEARQEAAQPVTSTVGVNTTVPPDANQDSSENSTCVNSVANVTTAATTTSHTTLPSRSSHTWTPFTTSIGTRTLLTAPATTEHAAMWGQAPSSNPHILWMQGRFVGAEVPNRNGALWSVSDLEMGQASVTHGPLNWLHEDKHVIGTIADARMMPSRTAEQAAAESSIPEAHITALSGIWRWVYPEEASVVEMASAAGMLAYSMECISEKVECAGDAGCGNSYPYIEYAQGKTCDHLQERSSIRRLVNPTFLGGAVIVPPTRPGWAHADASVMTRAAAMAEKAYEDAGRPQIPASTWEQMVASVVRFGDSTT